MEEFKYLGVLFSVTEREPDTRISAAVVVKERSLMFGPEPESGPKDEDHRHQFPSQEGQRCTNFLILKINFVTWIYTVQLLQKSMSYGVFRLNVF